MNSENLAWLDIETTGLNPHKDAILEIGVVITTKKLEYVDSRAWVTYPSQLVLITNIDPFVFKMHVENGLWEESMSEEASPLAAAQINAYEFIKSRDAKGSPMCGSTISFDRSFIQAQCPDLLDAFHYRNIDVSTVKNLMEMYHPDVFKDRPQGEKKHRTISDCRDSIAELKHYATKLGWEL